MYAFTSTRSTTCHKNLQDKWTWQSYFRLALWFSLVSDKNVYIDYELSGSRAAFQMQNNNQNEKKTHSIQLLLRVVAQHLYICYMKIVVRDI